MEWSGGAEGAGEAHRRGQVQCAARRDRKALLPAVRGPVTRTCAFHAVGHEPRQPPTTAGDPLVATTNSALQPFTRGTHRSTLQRAAVSRYPPPERVSAARCQQRKEEVMNAIVCQLGMSSKRVTSSIPL